MSNDNKEGLKKVSFLPYSGKQTEWVTWSKKTIAIAAVEGYKGILMGKVEVKPDDWTQTTETPAEIAEIRKNQKLNSLAYSKLLLAQQDATCFQTVENCCTEEFPDGNARLVWENLSKTKEPKTNETMVQLKARFYASSLKSKWVDPGRWVTYLENLRARIIQQGGKMEEIDLKIHISGNLVKEYDPEVKDWNKEGLDQVSMATIRQDLTVRYEKIKKFDGKNGKGAGNADIDFDDETKEEAALSATGTSKNKRFKG